MRPSERSGVNGIRVNGPSGLRAGARVHSEKGNNVCETYKGEMGGEWVKRGERVEGLKIGSEPENVAGRALVRTEEWLS